MFLQPNWPQPANVKAYSTTRIGGVSPSPYASFNLSFNVGDEVQHVEENRRRLMQQLQLPNEPIWLQQRHGNQAVVATAENKLKMADASFTRQPNQICIISTGDCVPILLCHAKGTIVAAIHAGWRGILAGVIENTLIAMNEEPAHLLAWLGPAIGPEKFEIGEDVLTLFHDQHPASLPAFKPTSQQKWLADIYKLAAIRLQQQGVTQIYGGQHCTYSEENLFYSHRRDKGQTGRMMSLIWIS